MKTSKLTIVLAAGIVFLGSQSVEAVVNIQNVGAGARSAALGNSYVAIADDADAVFANPAGLGQISQTQLAYTNVSLFYGGIEGDDLGQHVVSYVMPLGSKLGLKKWSAPTLFHKTPPKGAQERPRVPQERPRVPKSAPRAPQERPRAAQEAPGERPNLAKISPGALQDLIVVRS